MQDNYKDPFFIDEEQLSIQEMKVRSCNQKKIGNEDSNRIQKLHHSTVDIGSTTARLGKNLEKIW
jgi:hypothetical protein